MTMTDLQQYQISPVETLIPPVAGFSVAGLPVGIRKSGRPDMTLIASATPCTAAGVFTTNLVKAAPVLLDQQHLQQNSAGMRAVVINAGVANACTGEQGVLDASATADHTAAALGCAPEAIFVMSTGVIGVPLPMEKITAGVDQLANALAPNDWAAAAEGILTTDTVSKTASVTVQTPDGSYTVAGIAKGSGMIAPNMATMLSVIVTDATVSAPTLQAALSTANGTSFNQIVVDGDMSTNDTVLALANGASGISVAGDEALAAFQSALTQVCEVLAKDIVMDGEGATRFITLHVTGAADAASARQVAMTIATSALVKTAFYGADANWGRILAAAGRANVPLDPNELALWIDVGESDCAGGLQLVAGGSPTAYSEDEAGTIMSNPEVSVRLDLGQGSGASTVWTCDLSHDYVSINGHYRT